ncbi:MAG: sulfite exporter TauE/SafE family protein [Alphaproteobacteria bacterium]|jgi:uncharacterized membrane protein YfcA
MWESIDPLIVVVATVAFFLGGLLKGVVGMGLPLVAIPIVALVMPVAQAIPLMLAPGYVMNIIQVRQTWHARTSLIPWLPMIVGIAVGITVGVQIATSAPEALVRGVLGGLVILFVLMSLAKIELPPRLAKNRLVSVGMGGLTGLSGGLTGGFGATLAMYLLACGLEKDRFVWVIGVSMFIGVIFLTASLYSVGSLNTDQMAGTIGVLVPSWIGLTAGGYVRKKVSQRVFRNIALSALLVMGVSLLISALR